MGGWEQWCHEVAEAFSQRGHNVSVLTSNYGQRRVARKEPGVRRTLYLESDIQHYRILDFFLTLDWRDRQNARIMADTINETDPEIVFIWGMWQLDPRLARQAEAMRPGRVAYYFCGYWPIEQDPHSRFWLAPENKRWVEALKRPLARMAMAKQHGRVNGQPAFRHSAFVSNAVLRILQDAGISFENERVIYGGVDLTRFGPADSKQTLMKPGDQIQILYAGSLSKVKGVDTLLRAMGELAKRLEPDRLHLSLIGAGHQEFEAWAREFVDSKGLTPYVSFLGRFEHSEMPGILRSFNVLAFPSAWQEPLARVMMEGMASGLALVSTTTGGTGEVLLDGENGLTFVAGDEGMLARRLEKLVTHPELIRVLARNGRSTAEELFDFDRMVDSLESFVCELA